MCAQCAGVFISRVAVATGVASVFFFRSHFFLFILNAFCYMPSEWPLRLSSALQSFVLFVSGRTGCAPPNAPYVVYTDERGQVTSAACRTRLQFLSATDHPGLQRTQPPRPSACRLLTLRSPRVELSPASPCHALAPGSRISRHALTSTLPETTLNIIFYPSPALTFFRRFLLCVDKLQLTNCLSRASIKEQKGLSTLI